MTYPAPAALPGRRGHPYPMIRIPHPVTVTQAVTRTRGGRALLLLIVAGTVVHHLGWADLTPDPTGRPPTDCVPVDQVPGYTTIVPGQTHTCQPVTTTTAP